MNENAAGEATVTPLTSENAREVFMTACEAILNIFCDENERQRLRENLLEILQNNDCRDIFVECVDEDIVIKAFTAAASVNHVELLQAFCDIGMNVNVKNQDGNTALLEASAKGSANSVRWLLDHGANVEVTDNTGFTALMYASLHHNAKVVEMLLQKNANIDVQNEYGETALMLACEYDCHEIVQLLLSHNADIDLKNNQGQTALDLAEKEDIKELLRNHVTSTYVLK